MTPSCENMPSAFNTECLVCFFKADSSLSYRSQMGLVIVIASLSVLWCILRCQLTLGAVIVNELESFALKFMVLGMSLLSKLSLEF